MSAYIILAIFIGVAVGHVATLLILVILTVRYRLPSPASTDHRLPYEPPAIADFGGGEYPDRDTAMTQLRLMREWLEQPCMGGISHKEAQLLNDMCILLGFTVGETQSVMGFAWYMLHTPSRDLGVHDDE